MTLKQALPTELISVREAARRALGPVLPMSDATKADKNFLFDAKRSDAGRKLPPYYLIYFLLVDLLGFRNLGRFEKLAWSVPVDYRGQAFLIEHRKFGVGVFVRDTDTDEQAAQEIVGYIKKATKVAQPFFDWLADVAVSKSALNVVNNSDSLFERFTFFRDAYLNKGAELEKRKDERIVTEEEMSWGKRTTISIPARQLRAEAEWLALATIDAFFSWTEHVFIHISILRGKLRTGKDVARLAEAEWVEKFRSALDLSDSISKKLYDQLVEIRRELRNFIAHGAFGKNGEAFHFHSGAGAVPVLLPHRAGNKRFTMGEYLAFDDERALKVIDAFVEHLWSGPREPAKLYIASQLPIVLTMAADGTYAGAMSSVEDMNEFVDYQSRRFDDAANMDW